MCRPEFREAQDAAAANMARSKSYDEINRIGNDSSRFLLERGTAQRALRMLDKEKQFQDNVTARSSSVSPPSAPVPDQPAPAPQAQQPVQQPTEQPTEQPRADGIQNSPDRRKRRIRQTPGVLIDGSQAGGKTLFGQ